MANPLVSSSCLVMLLGVLGCATPRETAWEARLQVHPNHLTLNLIPGERAVVEMNRGDAESIHYLAADGSIKKADTDNGSVSDIQVELTLVTVHPPRHVGRERLATLELPPVGPDGRCTIPFTLPPRKVGHVAYLSLECMRGYTLPSESTKTEKRFNVGGVGGARVNLTARGGGGKILLFFRLDSALLN